MLDLAKATFKLLEDTVVATVGDVRREAFRLATGNVKESPFDGEVLRSLRGRWAKLLDAPDQALVVDEGQPFLLRGLSQWLRKFEDPDSKFWWMEKTPLLVVFGLESISLSLVVHRFSPRS